MLWSHNILFQCKESMQNMKATEKISSGKVFRYFFFLYPLLHPIAIKFYEWNLTFYYLERRLSNSTQHIIMLFCAKIVFDCRISIYYHIHLRGMWMWVAFVIVYFVYCVHVIAIFIFYLTLINRFKLLSTQY